MSNAANEIASAVREVLYHSDDLGPTQALQKVAAERNLNVEKTKRVGEAVNNLRVLHMYKTAKDKSANIPLADVEKAIAGMAKNEGKDSPVEVEKQSNLREYDSFYKTAEDNFRDADSSEEQAPVADAMLKTASINYPSYTTAPELFKKVASLKKIAEDAAVKKQHCKDGLEISTMFLAKLLKKAECSFSQFEKEAYLLHGKEIKPVIDMVAAEYKPSERFTGELTHQLVKDASVPHQTLSVILGKFAQYAKLYKQAADAERVYRVYDLSLIKVAAPSPWEAQEVERGFASKMTGHAKNLANEDIDLSGKSDDELRRLKLQLDVQKGRKELHGKKEEGGKGGGGGGLKTNPPEAAELPDLGMMGKAHELMDGFANAGGETKSKLNPVKIKAIAQYAIQHDPILSKRNPHTIIQAYKTMLKAAPDVAHDPNAAISFLRQATLSDVVSYNMIKDLTEIQKNMGQVSKWDKEDSGDKK